MVSRVRGAIADRRDDELSLNDVEPFALDELDVCSFYIAARAHALCWVDEARWLRHACTVLRQLATSMSMGVRGPRFSGFWIP